MAGGFGWVLEGFSSNIDYEWTVLVANAVAVVNRWEAGVTGPVGQPDPA